MERGWNTWYTGIVLTVIVAVFLLTAGSHYSYTPDDTYIYLQFAKNVVHNGEIAFNTGDPTYGVTSPLWLFIVFAGGLLGFDPYTWSKLIDLLLASAAIPIFYTIVRAVARDSIVAILATIAFSTHAWFLRWSGTGMETSLAVLLAVASFAFLLKRKHLLAVVATALLSHVRPEAAVLLVIIIADASVASRERKQRLTRSLGLLLAYIVLMAPWMIYAYRTFGTIVPNTALAKAGIGFNIDDGVSTTVDLLKTIAVTDGLAILATVVTGIMLILRRKKIGEDTAAPDGRDNSFLRFAIIGISWILMVTLVYVLTTVNIVSRYLLIVSPFIVLIAFAFLQRAIASSRWIRFAYAAVVLLAAGVMLQNQIVYWKYVRPGIGAFAEGMESCLIPIGLWLKDHTPPGTKVFAQDVGAIGYFSDREICDASGLVSPSMLRLLRHGYSNAQMMQEKMYRSVCQADYVVYRSFDPTVWRSQSDLEPVFQKSFANMGLSDPRINYYTVYKVKQ